MDRIKKIIRLLPVGMKAARRIINGKEIGFSFNLADRCPLSCNCYWRSMSRVPELSEGQVIEFFQEKKEEGLLLATIVGGEPYVRSGLLGKIAGILPLTWVVTSGTVPFLSLKKTLHVISVDGKDPETHDRLRRSPGLFNRILKNLENANRDFKNFPAIIHVVLNKANFKQIGSILEFWGNSALVDGVTFSFHTPTKGSGDEHLILNLNEKEQAIGELFAGKKEYGKFLYLAPAMIRSLHPSVTQKYSWENCPTVKWVQSFDASGKKLLPCNFSENADCRSCGCIINLSLANIIKCLPDFQTLRVTARAYVM